MEKPFRTHFAGVLLRDGDKILLMRSKSSKESRDGMRGLPGGHLEENEDYANSLAREIEEELKVSVSIKDFSGPLVLHAVDKANQEVFLGRFVVCDKWDGHITNNEPDKCSKVSRFHINGCPQQMSPYAIAAIKGFAEGKHYVEITV